MTAEITLQIIVKESFDSEKSRKPVVRAKQNTLALVSKRRAGGSDLVKGTMKCTAARMSKEARAKPVWVEGLTQTGKAKQEGQD